MGHRPKLGSYGKNWIFGPKFLSPKKWPLARKRKIFWGWFRWESCSPRYSGHLFHQQKSRSLYKKLTFGPKYPNFGVKKSTFSPPSGQLELHRSMFSTRKKVSHWNPDTRVPKFLLPAPKNWILGPKTAKFGPKLALWAKYWHFWPTWSNAWPKNNADKLPKWFSVMLVPKLLLNPIKIRLFGPKTAKIWSKICIFGHFGPNIAIFAHFVQRLTKTMWTGA